MRIRLLSCLLIGCLVVFLIIQFTPDQDAFITYYQTNLRGNLFAGFLTVGGFLLSLKIFIVIKLKENVYDHEEYKIRYSKAKKLDNSITRYGPLKRLSDFLFWSVLSTILASIVQLTFGLFENFLLCLFSLGVSVFAVGVLLASLHLIKQCLNDYFEFINKTSD